MTKICLTGTVIAGLATTTALSMGQPPTEKNQEKAPLPAVDVAAILDRVREHDFHPVDRRSFTIDRTLQRHGIADPDDQDWRIRLLAIRDLVRTGVPGVPGMIEGLTDGNPQTRLIAATALGVLRADAAVHPLRQLAGEDADALVRSAAVVALGRIGDRTALDLLRNLAENDPSADVRHQAKQAADRIEKGMGAEPELADAYRALDPKTFGRVLPGDPTPDFTLTDTDGIAWRLREQTGDQWMMLIWIFTDWCPVCHREFQDLIQYRERAEQLGVTVATIEATDFYRSRVMVGKEIDMRYRHAPKSLQDLYRQSIWWPHLTDHAGAVGARYGVDPLAYAVHAEYINRPATIIIDPSGTVRLSYIGTYWGDRPSIRQALDMIETENFEFEHSERLSVK